MKPKLILVKGGGSKRCASALPNLDSSIEQFLELKKAKEEWTVEFYRKGLNRYKAFPGACYPPTSDSINAFIRFCQEQPGRKEEKASKATVHAYYRSVRAWTNWLHKIGVMADNPIELAEPPTLPKRKIPRAPKQNTVKDLTTYFEKLVEQVLVQGQEVQQWKVIRDMLIISLAVDTGLRIGEVENIRVAHIDHSEMTIHVSKAKDHEERDVVYGKSIRGDLNLWLRIRSRLPLPESLDHLFVSYYRGTWRHFTHWGMRRMVLRSCTLVGVDPFTPHCLRHFFANQTLRNGGDLEFVRHQLGHASLITTSIYTIMHTDEMLETHLESSPRDNL